MNQNQDQNSVPSAGVPLVVNADLPAGWIVMPSGAKVWPLDETGPSVFTVGDIAQRLAHICRFGGSFGQYSVAEHCVRMARAWLAMAPSANETVTSPEGPPPVGDADHLPRRGRGREREVLIRAMALLLHDAAEAVTFDVARTIKPRVSVYYTRAVGGGAVMGSVADSIPFATAEARIHRRIVRALLGEELGRELCEAAVHDFVREMDTRMLRTEAEVLCPAGWREWPEIHGVEPLDLGSGFEAGDRFDPEEAAGLFERDFARLCKALGVLDEPGAPATGPISPSPRGGPMGRGEKEGGGAS